MLTCPLKVSSCVSKGPLCQRKIFTVKWGDPTCLVQVIRKANGWGCTEVCCFFFFIVLRSFICHRPGHGLLQSIVIPHLLSQNPPRLFCDKKTEKIHTRNFSLCRRYLAAFLSKVIEAQELMVSLQRLLLSQGPLRKAGRTFALTGFEVCVISCRMAFAFTAPHVAPCPDFYTWVCHWNIAWAAWVNSAPSEGCSLQVFAGFYSVVKLSQNITDIPGWLNCSWAEIWGKVSDAKESSSMPGGTGALAKI